MLRPRRNPIVHRPWLALCLWLAIVLALALTLRVWQLMAMPVPPARAAGAPALAPSQHVWH